MFLATRKDVNEKPAAAIHSIGGHALTIGWKRGADEKERQHLRIRFKLAVAPSCDVGFFRAAHGPQRSYLHMGQVGFSPDKSVTILRLT